MLSNEAVGGTLRRLRREHDLGPSVVASRAHIGLSLIQKIEGGECSCSLRALFAIARALELKPSDVVRQIEDSVHS